MGAGGTLPIAERHVIFYGNGNLNIPIIFHIMNYDFVNWRSRRLSNVNSNSRFTHVTAILQKTYGPLSASVISAHKNAFKLARK